MDGNLFHGFAFHTVALDRATRRPGLEIKIPRFTWLVGVRLIWLVTSQDDTHDKR